MKASDLREKQLKVAIYKVHKQNINLKEQQKVHGKQLEFVQDVSARTAIELQAMQQTMQYILEKSTGIMKEEAERHKEPSGIG